MDCKQVGILTGGKWDKMHECIRRVYDADAISPTITSGGGGHHEVKIVDFKIYGEWGDACEVSEVYSGSTVSCKYPMNVVDGISKQGLDFVTELKNGNSRATMAYNMRYCKRGYQLVR